MKLPKLFLGLFVWLASMGTAYYVGLNSFSPLEPESKSPGKTEVAERRAPLTEALTGIKPTGRQSDVTRAIMEISQQDLDEALRQADNLGESDKRALLAEAFALPANDYRRAGMIRALLRQLAESSPRDALAMAENIGSRRETERARIAILQVWAESDPPAALAWAEIELANEPLRSQTSQLLAIYRGYAASNPQAAFAAALAMPATSNAPRPPRSKPSSLNKSRTADCSMQSCRSNSSKMARPKTRFSPSWSMNGPRSIPKGQPLMWNHSARMCPLQLKPDYWASGRRTTPRQPLPGSAHGNSMKRP
jgi:hypothetical protein